MRYHPGISAVLSFFVPGLGFFYCEEIIGGLALLVGTLFAYSLFLPLGFMVHFGVILLSVGVAKYKCAN